MPRTAEANYQIREERRIQILEKASKVFAYKGLSDTKIADIAAEAGVSQGLLYRYYASKEEVFAAAVAGNTSFILDLIEQTKAQPGTALQKLEWFTTTLLPFIYQQPEGALVITHALVNAAVPEAVRQAVMEYSQKLQAEIKPLIVEGQTQREIIQGEPEQLTILYLSTLQGLAMTASFLQQPNEGFPDAKKVLRFLQP
jgi:AcrR family transcriptional regulator